MSFLKTIQLFVANNPGLTNREIAAALSELAELIGCSSQNAAAEHVKALKKKGYLSIAPGAARGITVVKTELDADPVAIIKGLISGGDKARVNAVEWLKKQGVTV
ncbi:LexA family transcriptional regulator [Enterobacter mori]